MRVFAIIITVILSLSSSYAVADDYSQIRDIISAAEQGDATAQYHYGRMFHEGVGGVEQDDGRAVIWWEQSAKQGYLKSQIAMAAMYENGTGVRKNPKKLAYWLELAANRGHMESQFKLGKVYADGRGLPENDANAIKWYRRAALQGDGPAQYNLGAMYADTADSTIEQDYMEAHAWLSLAAENGVIEARYALKDIQPNLKGARRWTAQKRLSAYRKKIQNRKERIEHNKKIREQNKKTMESNKRNQ